MIIPPTTIFFISFFFLNRSALDHVELSYAEEVSKYNGVVTSSGGGYGIKPNLVEKFSALFPEEKEQEIALMWDIVKAMSGIQGQ